MEESWSCPEEFLEHYRHMIRRGARKALSFIGCTDPESHAEDVSSEVDIKVFRHWNGIRSPERVIHAIIHNAASDYIKKCHAEVAQEIPDSATPCFAPPGQDPGEKLFDLLLTQELVSRLNPLEQYVIQRWAYGDSFEDIGKSLNMPSASVRSIKSRAVGKIRKIAGS